MDISGDGVESVFVVVIDLVAFVVVFTVLVAFVILVTASLTNRTARLFNPLRDLRHSSHARRICLLLSEGSPGSLQQLCHPAGERRHGLRLCLAVTISLLARLCLWK